MYFGLIIQLDQISLLYLSCSIYHPHAYEKIKAFFHRDIYIILMAKELDSCSKSVAQLLHTLQILYPFKTVPMCMVIYLSRGFVWAYHVLC